MGGRKGQSASLCCMFRKRKKLAKARKMRNYVRYLQKVFSIIWESILNVKDNYVRYLQKSHVICEIT